MRSIHLIGLALLLVSGCTMPTRLPATSDSGETLIHVPGWNGPVQGDRDLLLALRDGGCGMEMETFDWTAGDHGLLALWRAQHCPAPARELAGEIESVRMRHPGRAIDLTADSSGCGVALAAVASLPPDVHVRTVILSSPAVSPGYDLRAALRHVDDQIVSFNSPRDWIICGLGTTIFGTADNHHTAAAGQIGFTVPANDPDYAKLNQQTFTQEWQTRYGHTGQHAQSLSPKFAKAMIAPLLVKSPNQ